MINVLCRVIEFCAFFAAFTAAFVLYFTNETPTQFIYYNF